MKRTLVMLSLGFGLLFGLNPQTASKDDLMKIKGVGETKAAAIIKYRKSHKLKTAEDLAKVKGIGEVIAQNILKDVLNGEKSSTAKKKTSKKKAMSKKMTSKMSADSSLSSLSKNSCTSSFSFSFSFCKYSLSSA